MLEPGLESSLSGNNRSPMFEWTFDRDGSTKPTTVVSHQLVGNESRNRSRRKGERLTDTMEIEW